MIDDFISLVKKNYNEFHCNRSELLNDLNLFYILEFTFSNPKNSMVRCLWHKDWDHLNIHWNFDAQELMKGKTVVWSVPRDIPFNEFDKQFNGLSEVLFLNLSLEKMVVSNETEL